MISFMFWNIMLRSGHIIIHTKKIIWLWYPTKKNYLALLLSKQNYLAFILTQTNYLTPNKIQSPPLDIKWAAPYAYKFLKQYIQIGLHLTGGGGVERVYLDIWYLIFLVWYLITDFVSQISDFLRMRDIWYMIFLGGLISDI